MGLGPTGGGGARSVGHPPNGVDLQEAMQAVKSRSNSSRHIPPMLIADVHAYSQRQSSRVGNCPLGARSHVPSPAYAARSRQSESLQSVGSPVLSGVSNLSILYLLHR
jgi:hypothetical protein